MFCFIIFDALFFFICISWSKSKSEFISGFKGQAGVFPGRKIFTLQRQIISVLPLYRPR